MNGETFHEYWEGFNKLHASCPQYQISEQLLIQYFYEDLLPIDRNLVDIASGGFWLIRLQLSLGNCLISWRKILNNLELGNLSLGKSMSLVQVHL